MLGDWFTFVSYAITLPMAATMTAGVFLTISRKPGRRPWGLVLLVLGAAAWLLTIWYQLLPWYSLGPWHSGQ